MKGETLTLAQYKAMTPEDHRARDLERMRTDSSACDWGTTVGAAIYALHQRLLLLEGDK